MKTTIISSIICLAIGYFLYPVLNSNSIVYIPKSVSPKEDTKTSVTTSGNSKVDTSFAEDVTTDTSIHESSDDVLNNLQTSESEITDTELVVKQDAIPGDESMNIELSPAQIELNQWAATNKKNLLKLINEKIPEKNREHFLKNAIEGNEFIDAPTI